MSTSPTIWVTSDHHFGHANIIQYCNRPFSSVEEMDEALVTYWNETVAPEDTVWHLGDFAAFQKKRKRIVDLLSTLHGTLHLVRGNHDWIGSKAAKEAGFASFQRVAILDGLVLCHYPAIGRVLSAGNLRAKRALEEHSAAGVVHGHVHNTWKHPAPGHYNVSVDVTDFRPVAWEQMRDYFKDEGHHPWCNLAGPGVPRKGCPQCDKFFSKYPLEGRGEEEMMSHYFPDAVRR